MTEENRPIEQENTSVTVGGGEAEPSATTDLTDREMRLAQLRASARRQRRRMLIVFASIAVGVALLFGAVALIDALASRPPKVPEYDFHFYQPYPGDIMEYQPYLALDRQVYYCEDPSGDGLRSAVNEQNMTDYDTQVLFLYLYLQTIISGNAEAYNAYFNDTYYKTAEGLESFSPQMLYEMEIVYQGSEAQPEGEKLVSYRLDYKIHRNDGTFRRDVESDASRPQTVTLRISADGEIAIERLVTHHLIVK